MSDLHLRMQAKGNTACQTSSTTARLQCLQRNWQRKMKLWRGSELERKDTEVAMMGEGTHGRWAVATCGVTGHIAAWCRKGGNTNCTPLMKMTVKSLKKQLDNEEVLQLWCSLEESENEQWQEVISRRDKQKVKKASPTSLLSVENSHYSNSCSWSGVCLKTLGGMTLFHEGQGEHGLMPN